MGTSSSAFGFLNKDGLARLKYFIQAFGMPFFRHCETAGGDISHKAATFVVPPKASIISSFVFSMKVILSQLNTHVKEN